MNGRTIKSLAWKKFRIGIYLGFGIWFVTHLGRLGFTESLVFQYGDTLKFYKNDSLIDQWILKSGEIENGGYFTQRVKVSSDNKKFLFYEEKDFPASDSIYTKLTVYSADKKKIWTRIKNGKRKICLDLTQIYPDKIILFTTDRLNSFPIMEVVKNKNTDKLVDMRGWKSIVNYEISANGRYCLFHTRKPYNNKMWDYIYFVDLESNKDWEYLFPFCFSCKRGNLALKVDDDGKSEVIYKNEHRIFDKEGNLIDVFVKLD